MTLEIELQAILDRWSGMTKTAIITEGIEKYGVPAKAQRVMRSCSKDMTINIIGVDALRWLRKQA